MLASMRHAHIWLEKHALLWGGVLLAVALAIYAVFQVQILPQMGLWYDELFSLWAGDPQLTFGDAFATRILPDTNGPIYFSLIYYVQAAGLEGRAAFLALNFTVIGILLALMVERGWRHGMTVTALVCAALLLLTAPLLIYGAEGRVYGMAMALGALAAFEAGRLLLGGQAARSDVILIAALGVLAAWMHVFGAILVGSLATGVFVTNALMIHRRDLAVWSLVAGISTSAALLAWLALASQHFTNTTSWIQFSEKWVFDTLWELKNYMVGSTIALIPAAGFVALSLMPRHSRTVALTLVITGLLLFAIPLAVSFKMPIFVHRYILIGFPALLVLSVFLLRSHLIAGRMRVGLRPALLAFGFAFLLVPVARGIPAAQQSIASRPYWLGWEPVLKAADACPDGEIRVATFTQFDFGFAYFLEGKLTPVSPSTAAVRDVAAIDCPVLAWGEHFVDSTAETVTIEQVLSGYRLTNTSGIPLVLFRHTGGFVLARADAKLT
ncbi:MAG: hypothetical protein EON93_12255 [Burkholderiales bacterium]|nr:MAG: hypothetical protein EON93_12255 [Burkholderiales bacterium]